MPARTYRPVRVARRRRFRVHSHGRGRRGLGDGCLSGGGGRGRRGARFQVSGRDLRKTICGIPGAGRGNLSSYRLRRDGHIRARYLHGRVNGPIIERLKSRSRRDLLSAGFWSSLDRETESTRPLHVLFGCVQKPAAGSCTRWRAVAIGRQETPLMHRRLALMLLASARALRPIASLRAGAKTLRRASAAPSMSDTQRAASSTSEGLRDRRGLAT